jgi:hypothetical protein
METETVRWRNEHNVYVDTGLANQDQLQASVNVFKTELVRLFPGGGYEKCEFIVNLVTDVSGNSYRYAYIWVSDPRVYYILTGFNPDGSERYENEEDETSSKEKSADDSFDLDSLSFDDVFKSEGNMKKAAIRKPLPPILTLPGYEYSVEQKKKAEEDLKAEASKNGRNPDDVVVPTVGYFETSRAWAGSPEKDKNPSILCSDLPNWITEDILKEAFFKFSSDKSGFYPKITFKPKTRFNKEKNEVEQRKIAYVEFSRSHLKDGIFALQMTRKLILKDKQQELKNRDTLRRDKTAVVPPVKSDITIWKFFRNIDVDFEDKGYNKASGGGGGGSFDKFKGRKDNGFRR